jgi:acetyl esterase/lipase
MTDFLCRADPLRDDALIYEHILKEQGTPTRTDVYPGIPHAGPDFLPMHSVANKAVKDLKMGVEWVLKQE